MPHLKVSMLCAAAVLLSVPLGALPASAEEPPPEYPTVTLTSPLTQVVDDSFTIEADVDLKGAPSLVLTPTIGTQYAVTKEFPATTVTQATCPAVCHFQWDSRATSEADALPSRVTRVKLEWTVPDLGVTSATAHDFYYDAPVEAAWISGWLRDSDPTLEGYPDAFFGSGGTLTSSSDGPLGADQYVDVQVRAAAPDGNASPTIWQTEVPWDQEAGADGRFHSRVHLDTSAWAEGRYEVRMSPRDGQGRWGYTAWNGLVVRHTPVVTIDAASPPVQAWGMNTPTVVGARVQRPLNGSLTPTSLRVTVDNAAPQVLKGTVYWSFPGDQDKPASGIATLPQQLGLGSHTITVEVLDQYGNRLGLPGSSTVRVVEFTDTVTVPPLVVGQTSQITFAGTAPAGLAYDSCTFALHERTGQVGGGGACPRLATTYRTTVPWTPQTSGAGRVELSTYTTTMVRSPTRIVPVTVYAARKATLTAPSSSKYATRLSATVAVTDTKSLATTVAAAGIPVTLQRKAIGSSTWSTIGTGTTGSTGRVALSFANTANGQLRAVLASAVPGRLVTTSERTVRSIATVTWSAYPAATPRSGATLYATVSAKPYETGAKVQVQARYRGGAWKTLTTQAVPSSGSVRASFRLYSRGAWDVRVVRVATPLRAAGYSTTRRVTVQ